MKSISEMSLKDVQKIQAILFDLDGTFVSKGVMESEAYSRLEMLQNSGIKTIVVTGRPAGWCDMMARWWPIDAVIGENGAFFYKKVGKKIVREAYHSSDLLLEYQDKLKSLFEKILKKYNNLKLSSDQSFRNWDIAIDIAEESNVDINVALDIVNICESEGAKAAISNIHVNIWFGDYNKELMSLKVLDDYGLSKLDAIYIGDSPNDSPMFGRFPLSVGVNSVTKYEKIIDNLPKYITDADGSEGFVELVDFIFSTK